MQVPSMISTRWAAIGAAGECDVPATATGLVLNVTAVGATLPTFLTVYPAGAERPNASSLNPSPGQPPVPNAVTSANWTCVGICAHQSALDGGAIVRLPEFTLAER